jgi:hypothetical protein
MNKTHAKGSQVGRVAEQSQGNHRIFGQLPLVEEEEHHQQQSKYDQAERERTIPGMRDTTTSHAEKEHDHSTYQSEHTKPVDRF